TWGYNAYGELGDGTKVDRNTPVAVGGLANVTALGGGAYHSLAVLADGSVRSWGGNSIGQLGNGTEADSSTPTVVSGLTNVQAVVGGFYHSLALRTDGTVWAWGADAYGQLGDGLTGTHRDTAAPIPGLTGVTSISAGYGHSLAALADGSVMAW